MTAREKRILCGVPSIIALFLGMVDGVVHERTVQSGGFCVLIGNTQYSCYDSSLLRIGNGFNPFPAITMSFCAAILVLAVVYVIINHEKLCTALFALSCAASVTWILSSAVFEDYVMSFLGWVLLAVLLSSVYLYADELGLIRLIRRKREDKKNGVVRKMEIKVFSNGLLGSNTYLVWDKKSLEAMVIDCGNAPKSIAAECEKQGLKLKYTVLTHGHYDHADYVLAYKEFFPESQVVCHETERSVLSDPEANVSELLGASREYPMPDMTVADGDIISLGELDFKVLHTPGHTPGCICLYCEKEKILFTGDTLFVGGYGRTDFKYGSIQELVSSLHRLTALPEDTVFYSGHGEAGKLSRERKY